MLGGSGRDAVVLDICGHGRDACLDWASLEPQRRVYRVIWRGPFLKTGRGAEKQSVMKGIHRTRIFISDENDTLALPIVVINY
jgi:hypothetical protein